MDKRFSCVHGHHWDAAPDDPLGLANITCPECGAAAETLPPQDSSQLASPAPPLAREVRGNSPVEVPAALANHPRYRITGVLGRGGMGTVFQAEHRVMERTVALKVIRPDLLAAPGVLARFQREVKAAARLSHPNIVQAHDAEQAGSVHFLVMEHVEGKNLGQRVAEEGPLAACQACDFIRQALLGLQHAHERGMVHRDLKPQNLICTPAGVIKICDFGLARLTEGDPVDGSATHPGVVLGTVDFMAPEQAAAAGPTDIRADIYSLGATLYFLLTGQAPFPTGTLVEKLRQRRQADPPNVKSLQPDLPPGLGAVVQKMMARTPEARYQTPAAAAAALAPFATPSPRKPRRGLRPVLVLGFLLGLVLLSVFIIRLATDWGKLEIRTEVKDVQVAVLQGGEEVEILDLRTREKVSLRPGRYELKLKKDRGELLILTEQFQLQRGDQIIAEVIRRPRVVPVAQTRPLVGHRDIVYSVAFSSDGQRAISGGGARGGQGDYEVRIWDVATGRLLRSLKGGHKDSVRAVLFVPGKDQVLSGSWDHWIRLWDVPTERIVGQALAQPRVRGLAVSPNGQQVVSVSAGEGPRLWQLRGAPPATRTTATFELSKVLQTPSSMLLPVAWSADGRLILTAGSYQDIQKNIAFRIWVWNSQKDTPPRHLDGHTGGVFTAAFTPDGQRIVSGGEDRTLRVWSVTEGRELFQLPGPHGEINAVAISPDGRHAVSGSSDLTVRLWDLESRREVGRIEKEVGLVTCVAWSPTGRQVLFGGRQGLRLWEVPSTCWPRAR